MSGYTGGTKEDPTYEEVSAGNTGHVEVVKIEYDPAIISFEDLLAVFFNTHDPTTKDKQGNDIGAQYNSAIFYSTDEQRDKAESLIDELNREKAFVKPVITIVKPLEKFYEAEDYHQRYFENHRDSPYCEIVIGPKLEKLQKRFAELLKE